MHLEGNEAGGGSYGILVRQRLEKSQRKGEQVGWPFGGEQHV
jgi:hypothetical protein